MEPTGIAWEDIGETLSALAERVALYRPDVIIGCNRGGGIVGGFLAKKLDLERLHLLAVEGKGEKQTVTLEGLPSLPAGCKVLIADDAFSTGSYLKGVFQTLHEQYPEAEVKTVVLVRYTSDTPIDQLPYFPDYIGMSVREDKEDFPLPWFP